jgi:ABC-type Fe3+-hydroxamate transport system substrate-binding protein
MIFVDQLKRSLELPSFPKRIVSLVPSQTELLVDLGLESSIVGITKFCVHPSYLRKLKSVVGGTKQVNFSKIKDLKPDIILCNKEENIKDIVSELEKIAPVHISDINTIEQCFKLINMYGELFDVLVKAQQLFQRIEKERDDFKLSFTEPKLKVAYFIWNNPNMVVGSDTFINEMLSEARFINVFQGESRYPEIELNHPKLMEADAIFLSSEPYPFKEEYIKEFESQFPKKQILIVDGELFSWYGSRLLKSYSYFSALHNEK